ncbi:MAG: LPXTG cell wall anchor domain-containing protein [Actinomycetota bacterium]
MHRILVAAVGAVAALGLPAASASAGVPDVVVAVDLIVEAGDVDRSDVDIEIFEGTEGDIVATGNDLSDEVCTVVGDTGCYLPDLDSGFYQLGIDLPEGFELVGGECGVLGSPDLAAQRLPREEGYFTIGQDDESVRCAITIRGEERPVSADVVVINDDGGTADGTGFIVEVFDSGGALYDSGTDPAPNDSASSAEFDLPVGDYTFGISGADGYEVTVDVAVSRLPAIINDPSAAFTVGPNEAVVAVLTADDIPEAETTTTATQSTPLGTTTPPEVTASTTTTPETTTTATAAPPTAAPPTAAPPTAAPPTLAAELPATGATRQTLPILALALGLLALGAGAVVFTRRS